LYYRGPRGLKTFRCKYVLNVFFGSSLLFLFRSNRVLTRSSWRAVASLGVRCEWRYRSLEAQVVSQLDCPSSLGWPCILVDYVRTRIEAYRNVRR
jgi:hypothetical protein